MELEYLLQDAPRESAPFNQICLYILQPNAMPHPWEHTYRCGIAGIKESADVDRPFGSKRSNLVTRMTMYWNSWIQGGRLHAALTIPASLYKGFSDKVMQGGEDAEDTRPLYARAGKTMGQVREKEFHSLLDKNHNIVRKRSEKSEWFSGPLRLMKKAMQQVGGGDYFDFLDGNKVPDGVRLLKAQNVTRVWNRRSPRLIMTEAEIDSLRNPSPLTEEVVERLVRTVVPPPRRRSVRLNTEPVPDYDWQLGSTNLRRSRRLRSL
jgi:hypothetical protein